MNKDTALILMDIQMPEMDGFEATRKILEINPKVPIIAQTAFSYSEEKKRILSLGCVDYVSKPIDKNILYKKMANILTPINEKQ
jgi:CheY-like chemotaxis protein